MATIDVTDNAAQRRYEARLDGTLAGYAEYRDAPGRRIFTHTQVDDAFEGHGVGGALASAALDDVRRAGLAVVPRCPFIAAYIERHPEYADLVHQPT
ncbi:MAG: GNAT family N-acetyltransferase [Acidimicrobiales bacterium]